jgi:hypothetical protein
LHLSCLKLPCLKPCNTVSPFIRRHAAMVGI